MEAGGRGGGGWGKVRPLLNGFTNGRKPLSLSHWQNWATLSCDFLPLKAICQCPSATAWPCLWSNVELQSNRGPSIRLTWRGFPSFCDFLVAWTQLYLIRFMDRGQALTSQLPVGAKELMSPATITQIWSNSLFLSWSGHIWATAERRRRMRKGDPLEFSCLSSVWQK